jgi:hypothetical protein
VPCPYRASTSSVTRSTRWRRSGFIGGQPIASTALVAPISKRFVSDIHDHAAAHDAPLVHFTKGQRTDGEMADHLTGATGTDQILFAGVACPLLDDRRRQKGWRRGESRARSPDGR